MNVSLQDGYNIGWKLVEVLKKQSSPQLLKTYNTEREMVAADLIDFDRWFTKLFKTNKSHGPQENGTKETFADAFIKAGRYTAGLTAKYNDSMLTSAADSNQGLATNVIAGMRLPSAQVVRFCDAKAMQLIRALPANGRWRIVIFAGDVRHSDKAAKLREVCSSRASCEMMLTSISDGTVP